MIFFEPLWLLLAIPAGLSLWIWRPPSRTLAGLRLCLLLLVVLALSRPALKLPRRAGTVVVLADRSRSMPEGFSSAQLEALRILQDSRETTSQLAVVSFAEAARIEKAIGEGDLSEFSQKFDGEASDLSQSLELALSLIPEGSDGRLVVLSDGKWTGADPETQARRAAARGIPIDFRPMLRPSTSDLAVIDVEAPQSVSPGESYWITAWVDSPTSRPVEFELRAGGQLRASGRQTLSTGLNRLTLRDRAATPGTISYELVLKGGEGDPVPENNRGSFLVSVEGKRPLLVLSQTPGGGLARLLSGGGVDVRTASPDQAAWGLADLAGYSGLIIENVPAGRIGRAGMENVSAWVSETGAGLMMTGGRGAFGPGGYFESPLDEILPVSMELRQEHRKLSLAVVVAMDHSGSMAAGVAGGMTKMDLANRGAVEVLDLLSGLDEFGAVAVDSQAHVAVPLDNVEKNRAKRGLITSIAAQGGGIFIYEALAAASQELLKAKAGTRHILLFADAADSEEPGDYQELLRKCRQAGISVSVVGLGTTSDSDAGLLQDIAKRGEGQIYFTVDPQELPRLFAQDTFVVARSTFLEDETPLAPSGGLYALTGASLEGLPSAGGYNLTYLRPGAELAVRTVDEYEAPFTAFWQAGAGRALAYAGEVDGQFTGPLAGWSELGSFLSSLARWTAGQGQELPPSMLLTQQVRDGRVRVELQLDPEREADPFATLPQATVLRGHPGQSPQVAKQALAWESADLLSLEVPLTGSETVLTSVEIEGYGRRPLPPAKLLYSPEYRPADSSKGLPALQALARAGGGRQRLDLASVWGELPARPRLAEISPWLLALALVTLLTEVLERRTGVFTTRLKVRRAVPRAEPLPTETPRRRKRPRTVEKGEQPPASPPPRPEPSDQPAILEALRQARKRAGGRRRDPN